MDEVFSELSPEPLGAASLAQCHRGVLRDGGEVVAVKIQHPDVQTNGYTDMDTIQVRVTVCVCSQYIYHLATNLCVRFIYVNCMRVKRRSHKFVYITSYHTLQCIKR